MLPRVPSSRRAMASSGVSSSASTSAGRSSGMPCDGFPVQMAREVGLAPGRPRDVVRLQRVGAADGGGQLAGDAREAGLDHRDAHVVGAADERPLRRGARVLRHRRLRLEMDALPAQAGGRRVEVGHHEAEVVDGPAARRRGRRTVRMGRDQQQDVAERHAVLAAPERGRLAAHDVAVPGERGLGIG